MSVDWLVVFGPEMGRYLSLPVVNALVGYVTNVVAIWMMFHPIAFFGIARPWFGWQGIVPRHAAKMTGIAVDTITESLVTTEEMLGRLDAGQIAADFEEPLAARAETMIDTVLTRHHKWLWENLPVRLQHMIKQRARQQASVTMRAIVREVQIHGPYLIDLKRLVTRRLVYDKPLLVRILKEIGYDEFRFIGHSGAYFGFAFGLIQMGLWAILGAWWLLPLFAMLVGWATNWLALKMIFNPKQGMRLGRWRIQGLFFRRQNEVAEDYARLLAEHVIKPEYLFQELLDGPGAERFRALIARETGRAIDEALGPAHVLADLGIGTADYERLKAAIVQETLADLPSILAHLTEETGRRMAIRQTLAGRLQAMTPRQFEALLRPAFEQDEWILIAVGAVLGFMAGWLQLTIVFADVL